MRALRWLPAAVMAIVVCHPSGAQFVEARVAPRDATHAVQPSHPPIRTSAPPASAESPSTTPIPGGGRILTAGEDVAVVEADGQVTSVYEGEADAFWRPGGGIVVKRIARDATLQYRWVRGGWRQTGRWRIGPDYYSRLSPDGRWMAYSPFRRHRQTTRVQVKDLEGHVVRLPLLGYVAVSWVPDGRVLLERSGDLITWDPANGSIRSFMTREALGEALDAPDRTDVWLGDAWGLSWSANGRHFAAGAWWRKGRRSREVVVIGDADGRITRLLPTNDWFGFPTWSPVRDEVAFLQASHHGRRHRLYVVDAQTGQETLVRARVPGSDWAAWSPRGTWLLLADWTEAGRKWLFVSRDGTRTVDYPWLGNHPRWATPGADVLMPVC